MIALKYKQPDTNVKFYAMDSAYGNKYKNIATAVPSSIRSGNPRSPSNS
jgi:hypothetical protein